MVASPSDGPIWIGCVPFNPIPRPTRNMSNPYAAAVVLNFQTPADLVEYEGYVDFCWRGVEKTIEFLAFGLGDRRDILPDEVLPRQPMHQRPA